VSDRTRVLLVTKGHPYDRQPFFAVFDDNPAIDWCHVDQPAARALFHPDRADGFDAFVCYDMPGITFTRADPPTRFETPPSDYVAGFTALLEAGQGMVFLHHAIAGWPAWEGYARILGGRFHYQPGTLAGVAYPDSGYQFDVSHHVEVVDPDHPVCAGLEGGFDLTDELYLFPVLEDRVVPLLRTTFDMSDPSRFWSSDAAIRGRRNTNEGWSHPPGSQLVGWVKNAGRSPLVYLQFGDGPVTYADASFRRVLANAIAWVASPAAHAWAAERHDAGLGGN